MPKMANSAKTCDVLAKIWDDIRCKKMRELEQDERHYRHSHRKIFFVSSAKKTTFMSCSEKCDSKNRTAHLYILVPEAKHGIHFCALYDPR